MADFKEGAYYLPAQALALIPASLTGGARVNLGCAWFRPQPNYQGDQWLGLPKGAIPDLLRICLTAAPRLDWRPYGRASGIDADQRNCQAAGFPTCLA